MEPALLKYETLFGELEAEGISAWTDTLRQQCAVALADEAHGKLANWIENWRQLPNAHVHTVDAGDGCITISGTMEDVSADAFRRQLMRFHPWRKGPFEVLGVRIDTEWRSDWKWDRLKDHVELRDRSVLDVGCGNGYFGWKMLNAGARRVIGLDPFLLYVMQHEVIRRYAGPQSANYVLPVGDDCLPARLEAFDVTFSMGVLYHRTSPIDHLRSLCSALRPNGQLVLETLVIDNSNATVLVPEGRYAKMRNIWFIPSVSMLELWLKRSGFRNVTVVDVTVTSTAEQRSTDWMTFESLPDFLDPTDAERTIEGYPAPRRAILTATKR